MFAATVIYDILRDGIGPTPIVLCLAWLLGLATSVWVFARPGRAVRPPSRRSSGRLVLVWFALYVGAGGFGFGNVFYQHHRCRPAAASGSAPTIQGPLTHLYPQDPQKRAGARNIQVAGQDRTN